jgi:hypothetical protein
MLKLFQRMHRGKAKELASGMTQIGTYASDAPVGPVVAIGMGCLFGDRKAYDLRCDEKGALCLIANISRALFATEPEIPGDGYIRRRARENVMAATLLRELADRVEADEKFFSD